MVWSRWCSSSRGAFPASMLIFLGVRELLKAMENRCKVPTSTGERGISSTNSMFAYHTWITKITFSGSQPYISGTSFRTTLRPKTNILRSFRSGFFRSHRLGGKSRWTFVTRLKKGNKLFSIEWFWTDQKKSRVKNTPEDFHILHIILSWRFGSDQFLSF